MSPHVAAATHDFKFHWEKGSQVPCLTQGHESPTIRALMKHTFFLVEFLWDFSSSIFAFKRQLQTKTQAYGRSRDYRLLYYARDRAKPACWYQYDRF